MANSIALAAKYQGILDEIYKLASVTAIMDSPSKPINFAGANVVKVMKTSLIGLGDYSRATGYPTGDATITWETLTLAKDRGRKFSIDAMDDEETLGMAFGTLAGEYIRTKVAPEIDAYRFATYSSWSSVGVVGSPTTLSSSTVLAAIDVAKAVLDAAEVPAEGRILYVSDAVKGYIEAAITRMLGNENSLDRRIVTLDGMRVVMVPQTRFYTIIDLNAGATASAGGYSKNVSGKDINFLMVHPTAVLQVAKHNDLKVFDPAVNQDADAWIFDYRIYHDAFVYDNKVAGVYVHKKA